MKFFADLHCHTTYSDGRNTVDEMIRAARSKGLARLAITDHGPKSIGTGVKSVTSYDKIKADIEQSPAGHLDQVQHANQAHGVSREKASQLQVLLGAEADVIGLDGEIDLPEKVLKKLDWLIIGLHPYVWPAGWHALGRLVLGNQVAKVSSGWGRKVQEVNTRALILALHRYKPDCVSHPGLQMAVNLSELGRACAQTGTLFEINTGHRFQQVEDIRAVAQQGVTFVVNSDAHYTASVGDLAWGGELLVRAGVTADQVYNAVKG